jgi:hypothetical protein
VVRQTMLAESSVRTLSWPGHWPLAQCINTLEVALCFLCPWTAGALAFNTIYDLVDDRGRSIGQALKVGG